MSHFDDVAAGVKFLLHGGNTMEHLALAILAEDAYMEEVEFKAKWSDSYDSIRFIETEAGLECFVLQDKDKLVFAFRGTSDILDGVQDARAIVQAHHVWGKCHKGFYDSVDSAWSKLRDLCVNAGHVHVYITGHSKGAAEAVVFASRLENQIIHAGHDDGMECHIDAVVTFGSPRAFNPKAANVYKATLKDKTYRYVYATDPVALVPFSWRYRHVGNFRWWNGKKWRRRRNWFATIFKGLLALRTIRKTGGSHPIKNYVTILTEKPYSR
jgi:hypothetical protein